MIGFVNVYKPRGVTSFKIVGAIKRIYGIKRVGHLGTLDPMAEGVLPIAIGKATKFFDYFLKKDKVYNAEFKVGYETDTLDADGEIIEESRVTVSLKQVQDMCKNFIGKISQKPPKFSAIKINGQRAYKLARDGKEFEIKPKQVEIYGLTASNMLDENLFSLNIWCSAGTYIRSLGCDIFSALGTRATMTKLVRVRSGTFRIEDSKTIEEIAKDLNSALIPIDKALCGVEVINLNEEQFAKIKNGVAIEYDSPDGRYLAKHNNIVVAFVNIENKQMKNEINLIEGND